MGVQEECVNQTWPSDNYNNIGLKESDTDEEDEFLVV